MDLYYSNIRIYIKWGFTRINIKNIVYRGNLYRQACPFNLIKHSTYMYDCPNLNNNLHILMLAFYALKCL